MSTIRIRPATLADVAGVTELVKAAYGPWEGRIGVRPLPMDADYAAVIGTGRAFVAERDDAVRGVVVLGEDEEGFFIDNVAVGPAHQGAGAGRALLDHAEAAARAAGFDSIYLWTHEGMTENLAIYEARGYAEYDRRSPRPGAPALLVYMRKPLGRPPAPPRQAE